MNSARKWQVVAAVLLVALVLVSILAVTQSQAARAAEAKLDCARPWLEKAMQLHELHLRDPSTTTEESQLELMNQIMQAYVCVTGEPMPTMPAMGR